MATGSYISIITLNINGLNAPTKRQRLAKWIQKQNPYICCLQETQRDQEDKLKVKYPKKHTNQINEDQTQRTNIKSSKGKTTNKSQGDPQKDNS